MGLKSLNPEPEIAPEIAVEVALLKWLSQLFLGVNIRIYLSCSTEDWMLNLSSGEYFAPDALGIEL